MGDRAICSKCGSVCMGCLTGCSHSPCPHCSECNPDAPLIYYCDKCFDVVVDDPGAICEWCEAGRPMLQNFKQIAEGLQEQGFVESFDVTGFRLTEKGRKAAEELWPHIPIEIRECFVKAKSMVKND